MGTALEFAIVFQLLQMTSPSISITISPPVIVVLQCDMDSSLWG